MARREIQDRVQDGRQKTNILFISNIWVTLITDYNMIKYHRTVKLLKDWPTVIQMTYHGNDTGPVSVKKNNNKKKQKQKTKKKKKKKQQKKKKKKTNKQKQVTILYFQIWRIIPAVGLWPALSRLPVHLLNFPILPISLLNLSFGRVLLSFNLLKSDWCHVSCT